MTNAEFEDCYEPAVYNDAILAELGVDLNTTKFRGNNKWSDRLRIVFLDQGKPFTDSICAVAKSVVATAVSKNPKAALNEHKRNSIDALVNALERMVKN
jgi:putative ATP-dependent endonuclease of the OLD family